MAGQDKSAYPHRRSVEMLKAVFTKRRDVRAYADLCEIEDGLAPKDCETLAEMCLKRRRNKDALDGADLSSRIEILVMTREWRRVAKVIESTAREDLMALSHYAIEPVVKKLGRSHPLLVAKLRIAMGLRIVEAKKIDHIRAPSTLNPRAEFGARGVDEMSHTWIGITCLDDAEFEALSAARKATLQTEGSETP